MVYARWFRNVAIQSIAKTTGGMNVEKITDRLLSWASIIEENTLQQALQTSTMPFIYPHVALMPDAHLGKGSTVGSVVPTVGAIIPACVGVDIGCGMIAVQTEFYREELEGFDLSKLREAIEWAIPLSKGNYNQNITTTAEVRINELEGAIPPHHEHQPLDNNWKYQLGSLGSGNHFIEVSYDEEDRVWLFLHSGSRGVGNKLALMHIKVAQKLAKKYFIGLPDPDLAYIPDYTEEFGRYIEDLNWAQRFALLNREEMMDRVVMMFEEFVDDAVNERQRINCHHNFTQKENHFGRNVWLTRKGAIQADEGRLGLIPGSMGTASYVVAGKGNKLSMNSSPHGAGRVYSRSRARKTFTQEDLEKAMGGIEWRRGGPFIDEIPAAYKPIDVVMRDAEDLVTIKHTLHQLVNVKGD